MHHPRVGPGCRRCRLCGFAIEHLRADSGFCGDACRAEASRLRRILTGETVNGYETLADRFEAFRAEQKRCWRDFTTAAREEALVEPVKEAFDAVEVPA